MTEIASPESVLAFWRTAGPDKWFRKDAAFDAQVREKFLPTYEAGAAGRLATWEDTPEGALALLLVLDQFPRNMFRGSARIYTADPVARAVVNRAIARGFHRQVKPPEGMFFDLPLSHSEDPADQERSVAQARASGEPERIKWAEHHADIIRRFGRFPHRNALLGRTTTPAEQAYIDEGGFGG